MIANDYAIGHTFGRWKLLESITRPHHVASALCRCECGKERRVLARSLIRGKSCSCGCSIDVRVPYKTHGKFGSPAYISWAKMLLRCNNPKAAHYDRYGGRGIRVCERWRKFENFLEDMGERPPDFSIERIDNDGNYELSNCKWIPRGEQARNRSNTVSVELNGKRYTQRDVQREFGVWPETLQRRLGAGMSAKEALTTYHSGFDMTSIPDDALWAEVGRRRSAARGSNVGGRPEVMHKCRFCKARMGLMRVRYHEPRCEQNPQRRVTA